MAGIKLRMPGGDAWQFLGTALGANPTPMIVVINHLRSFIDIELLTGAGPRVRAKRTAQAESLSRLLQQLQERFLDHVFRHTTPLLVVQHQRRTMPGV